MEMVHNMMYSSTARDMHKYFEVQAQNETLTRRVKVLEDTLRFYANDGEYAAMQILIHATHVLLDTIDAYDSEQRLLTASHPVVWAVSRALDKLETINGTTEEPKA
jgi:hypothetical protein